MTKNPYEPSREVCETKHAADGALPGKSKTCGFRFRTIPASFCLAFGIAQIAASAFWAVQIWLITISSDDELAFKLVPPILFVGFVLAGIVLALSSRWWMRGRWYRASLAFVANSMLVTGTLQVATWLAPEMI